MSLNDLFLVGQWWLILFLIGLAFLPLTSLIFHSFFDRGYALSKILGLLLLSYLIWLLSSLKVLPFSSISLFIIWLVFIIINLLISWKKIKIQDFGKSLKIFILEEIIFLSGLIFWAFIRSFDPSIHGLEKFMDFGIISSILRTEYFPPKDIWLTPFTINYYYFGHLTGAVLTKISGFDSIISYSLILATLFGLTLSASFSLGANLYSLIINRYSLVAGFLSAFLVTLAGNLQTIYAFFQSYVPENPLPFWFLQPMLSFTTYWYPNATRFIPFTIHEFPIYSYVVADLHGHVFNIPFVLLFLALLLKMFFSPKIHRPRDDQPLIGNTYPILLGFLLAVFLMANVLDGPIYLLGLTLVLIVKEKKLAVVCKQLTVVLLATILFSLPFWLHFSPFSSGIGVLCAPQILTNIGKIGPFLFEANHCQRSPLWMLFILWGFFYLTIFIYFLIQMKKNNFKQLLTSHFSLLTLIVFATLLILIPEFFYVKDIYPAHFRANTVFKFSYQAFIILALISAYFLTKLVQSKKILGLIILIPFFFLVAIYPFFAINSYYNGLRNYQSLDGLKYLSRSYPADYQAIMWLRKNVSNQPVILEAQGDSYSDFARVSANTGLPTIIGWPVHEWLWRGSYNEAGKRVAEVAQIYESFDPVLTKQLLQKYQVQYIFMGDLERQKYLNLNEAQFQNLGRIVFQSGNTKIYELLK